MDDVLPRQSALPLQYTVPCGLSPLVFRIHSSLLSDRRHTVSPTVHSSTHSLPQYPRRSSCFVVTFVVSSLLILLQRAQHLLNSYRSRMKIINPMQRLQSSNSENSSSHSAQSGYRPLRQSLVGNSSLNDLCSRVWGVAKLLGLRVLLSPCTHCLVELNNKEFKRF